MEKGRKWFNVFLVIILVALFAFILVEFSSMMSIRKKRAEENNKPQQATQEKEEIPADDSTQAEDQLPDETGSDHLLGFTLLEIDSIPPYSGEPYIEINDGLPAFLKSDLNIPTFEYYSPLDHLGRCGVATANISKDLMPSEPRGYIGDIRPTGWHTVKYPELITDRYLYNRCHLIAYSLCGENDNNRNLITGTRYMNVNGMLPFENKVFNYIERTNNHVLYRVIPYFAGDELVARGVQIEAYSVEDKGAGICTNVFVYNVQPGIEINYATGDSWVEAD